MTKKEFESKRNDVKDGGEYWIQNVTTYSGDQLFYNVSDVKWMDDGIAFMSSYHTGRREWVTLPRKAIKSLLIYHVSKNPYEARIDYGVFRRNIQKYRECAG